MKSSTETLARVARILSEDVETQDCVISAALNEIAERLEEQQCAIASLYRIFQKSNNGDLFPIELMMFVEMTEKDGENSK